LISTIDKYGLPAYNIQLIGGTNGTRNIVYGAGIVPMAERQSNGKWITNQVAHGKIYGRTYWGTSSVEKKEYYHSDAIGNIIGISSDSAGVSYKAEYDPYGQVLYSSGYSEPDYSFVGAYGVRKLTATKKLMGVRHYDATVGRFLQEDPIGLQGGDINLMRYATNNPINRIDPAGLRVLDCRRPLDPWSGGTNTGPDSNANVLYHRYLCVNTTCSGLGPSGSIFGSPGIRTVDPYLPENCSEVPSNACFENCVMGKLLGPRPNYDIRSINGISCHMWAGQVLDECAKSCQKSDCKK
jgi:RHS repeat-associated protein